MRHVLRVVWWLLAASVVVGCQAEQIPVSATSSAVEQAPVEPPQEDLKPVWYYCRLSCGTRWARCNQDCVGDDNEADCDQVCKDGFDICRDMCDVIFPGAGGGI